MTAQMRTGPAARDPQFRGIDPPALNQVVKQLQDAQNAIQGWLNAHRPPPGVSTAGHRQAAQVAQWAADQLGMLSRRYNYAVTHPSPGGGVDAPPPPAPAPAPGGPGKGPSGAPRPARPPSHEAPVKTAPPTLKPTPQPTPRGAGDIGNFPDRKSAAKAARTDALAVVAAVQDGRPVPDSVWRHLKANADDPDYTEKLYERLGPAATADLLKAAQGDEARLKAVQESVGVASHHMVMDVKWLRAFLAEADRAGVRPVALQVLAGAPMSERARAAIAKATTTVA
ncbi:hypothetical protein HUT06_15120 [Actinomadura sp. NAK00032]|uniref:hypothetical protein n=1 Tax=Actinomadura sp. NAK00032 TaxID=2742128 RepID=UPI0015916BB3|nr:hypothetical protein [Actinomadura sp. NAK00032]QKW35204.1 hypothetical protein HUT06_15120 [Actinomadura sp. NAK00032]